MSLCLSKSYETRFFFSKYSLSYHDIEKDEICKWRGYTIIQALENSDEKFTSDSEFEESNEEDMNDQSLHFCDDSEVE